MIVTNAFNEQNIISILCPEQENAQNCPEARLIHKICQILEEKAYSCDWELKRSIS